MVTDSDFQLSPHNPKEPAPLQHQFLHVTATQAEAKIEPNAVANDEVREAVAIVADTHAYQFLTPVPNLS